MTVQAELETVEKRLSSLCEQLEQEVERRKACSPDLERSVAVFYERMYGTQVILVLLLLTMEALLSHSDSDCIATRGCTFVAGSIALIQTARLGRETLCAPPKDVTVERSHPAVSKNLNEEKVVRIASHRSTTSSASSTTTAEPDAEDDENENPNQSKPIKKSGENMRVDGIVIKTEAEACAVEELRHRLQDLKEECVHRPFDLSDLTLIRFVRARKLDLDAAEKLFRDAAEWRRRVNPRKVYEQAESQPKPEIEEYTTGGWLPGLDRDGSVVFVDRLGQLDVPGIVSKIRQEDLERLTIWRQETHVRLMQQAEKKHGIPQYQVFVIQDLKGLSMRHFHREGLKMMQAGTFIDDNMYPEGLKTCVVINAPRVFSVIWNVVKHFFDANTRAKVQIHSGPATNVLLKHIAPENLPKFLGGELEVDGDPECKSIIRAGGRVPASVPSLRV